VSAGSSTNAGAAQRSPLSLTRPHKTSQPHQPQPTMHRGEGMEKKYDKFLYFFFFIDKPPELLDRGVNTFSPLSKLVIVYLTLCIISQKNDLMYYCMILTLLHLWRMYLLLFFVLFVVVSGNRPTLDAPVIIIEHSSLISLPRRLQC
jgi:hypothetical protein